MSRSTATWSPGSTVVTPLYFNDRTGEFMSEDCKPFKTRRILCSAACVAFSSVGGKSLKHQRLHLWISRSLLPI
ncbi:hypothetical protein [Paenibacillus sp. EZ-K15]|uniref:hypothetical protein n=1 Tax=Paenibacillus sp. EZ-K15 TaxID=2044275 RepID=UPI00192A67E8|nr:hypothetical protein [Paenibacillus sp. EZ-K15]